MTRRPPAASAACVVLAVLAVGASSCSKALPRAASTPRPATVRAQASEIRTIPDVSDAVRAGVTRRLGDLLTDLYSRAFLPPLPVPRATAHAKGGTPSVPPTPVPRPPVGELFSGPARPAVEASPDAFRTGPGETVRVGTVRYTGIVTVEGDVGVAALLTVEFEAIGTLRPPRSSVLGSAPRALRVKQSGQLYLVASGSGWLIAGYDVNLTEERQVPTGTPAPTREASASSTPAGTR